MGLQGLTPIDTLYEFTGYSVSLQIGKYLLWNGYFLGFLFSGALLRLYFQGSREGSYRELAIYPLYVLFIFFLVWPIEVSYTAPMSGADTSLEEAGVFADGGSASTLAGPLTRPETLQVPRILAWVSSVVGSLQKNLTSDICDETHASMYQWKHIAAINSNTRIFGQALRQDLGVYLKCCYYPALTQERPPEMDPWKNVPLVGLPIDAELRAAYSRLGLRAEETAHFGNQWSDCDALHDALVSDLGQELASQDFHGKALGAYRRLAQKGAAAGADGLAAYTNFYRRRLVYNQMFVLGNTTASVMAEALPQYSLFKDGLLDLKYVTSETGERGAWSSLRLAVTKLPAAMADIASALSEGWSQKALGPATYYRVSMLGPYVYGLLLGFVLMAFPLAGLLAFWPSWWTAIVNYMKLFVSIKLWPIFWAYLSTMVGYRQAFTPDDPEGFQGTFGAEGMFPALALMYLVVPVFSFVVASIAQHAGGAIVGAILGPGQAASLGGTLGAISTPARLAVQLKPRSSE
jgi:hypothetical protein